MAEFDRYASRYKSALDRALAFSGDGADYFTEYKAVCIERLLGLQGKVKILDFGCGVGALSSALARRVPEAEIHGFDVSADSLGNIAPGLRERGLFTSDHSVLHADYDLIVVSNVMHHIPVAERQDTIRGLVARLAPGGRLLVIEHNPLNPLTRWVVGRCEFDVDASLLRSGEVKRYFACAGLSAPSVNYIVFFPRILAPLRPLERWLGWCPLGAQYVICSTRIE